VKYFPEYTKYIIVGVICNDAFAWYVTEKDYWFLDLFALKEAYNKKGYDIDITDPQDIRSKYPVLDKQAFLKFQPALQEYLATTTDLRELLLLYLEEDSQSWLYEMHPSLLIDFDNQKLYNDYYEQEAFENVIPKGWVGIYHDFLSYIPEFDKYWKSEEGKDLFQD